MEGNGKAVGGTEYQDVNQTNDERQAHQQLPGTRHELPQTLLLAVLILERFFRHFQFTSTRNVLGDLS